MDSKYCYKIYEPYIYYVNSEKCYDPAVHYGINYIKNKCGDYNNRIEEGPFRCLECRIKHENVKKYLTFSNEIITPIITRHLIKDILHIVFDYYQ